MRQTLLATPKAELHVHLEGSVRPETIRQIAGDAAAAQAADAYRYTSFADFIAAFKWVVGLLQGPDAYALAARALFAELATQGVTYAEVTLSAGVVVWKGLNLDEVFSAVDAEATAAPLQIGWVVDSVRQFGRENAETVARFAADRARQSAGNSLGIVAFGIGGDERGAPAATFVEPVARIKAAGLGFCPHAGENSNAENVREMVALGADRIGHGIRAVEDPTLVQLLAERNIPLEISLTSNVRLGAVPSYALHPLRQLYLAGVPIILNSDDPAMFQTDLLQEYELAAQHQGFSAAELIQLARHSLGHGFQQAR